LQLKDIIPQLWFAQTQNLFVGYHTNGQFQEVEKLSMKLELERWEKQHQAHLRKLVGLLKKLKDFVRTAKCQRCVIVCEVEKKPVCMRIYESDRMGAALPDDICQTARMDWRGGEGSHRKCGEWQGSALKGYQRSRGLRHPNTVQVIEAFQK
jgi:hypothetical protein